MTMRIAVASILVAMAAGAPAAAQDTVKIHVTYQSFAERLRPSPGSGTATVDYTLILSGKNQISMSGTASAGSQSVSGTQNTQFKNVVQADGRSATWRIAGPNKLVSVTDFPQSQEIQTITVKDKTCTIHVAYRLKPGFTEYMAWSITAQGMAYYRQMKFVGGTCTIE